VPILEEKTNSFLSLRQLLDHIKQYSPYSFKQPRYIISQ